MRNWAAECRSFRRQRVSWIPESVLDGDCQRIRGLSAPGGFDSAASRRPELARFAGSNSGAPPQTPQNQTTPRAIAIRCENLFNTLCDVGRDLNSLLEHRFDELRALIGNVIVGQTRRRQ